MRFSKIKALIPVLGLILSLLAIFQQNIVAYTEFVEPADRVFGYRVNLSTLGIRPKYIKAIDGSRVVIVGSIGDANGVAVLDVSDPYRNPVIEDLYPLTGSPTYVAIDGFPVTRIAIGSDKGEVLVLKVDKGVITKHLYRVLGTDFYVDKVYLARDATGGIKVVTLVVEGGARGYPCMNCYAYILDEEGPGIVRIGHGLGNATKMCGGLEHIRVQDVVPLAVYGDKGYYWDASKVFVAYIPRSISLTFNITYHSPDKGAYEPLPKALVEVRLIGYDVKPIVYGVNADDGGVVRVPIPYWEGRYTVNITIRDSKFNTIWSYVYVYDPIELKRWHGEVPDEIPLPSVRLTTPDVDTRPATKVYGVPPFLQVLLDLIDVSPSPLSCSRIGTADYSLSPTFRGLTFLVGSFETRYKVIHTDPEAGRLYIATLEIFGRTVKKTSVINDYIGLASEVVSSVSYPRGDYVTVGISDGRLRIYILEGVNYRLNSIYTMGSKLFNLVVIPAVEGYTYVAISSSGIQVFRIEPYLLPVYRRLSDLYLTAQGYVYGDALADLKMVTLVNSSDIIVVKNADIAVWRRLSLSMDEFIAKDVVLNIVMPGGEPVNGTLIVFRYPNGQVVHRPTKEKTVLRNIVFGIDYTVDIRAPKPYIYNGSITFRLRENGLIEVVKSHNVTVDSLVACCRLDIGMKYREYTVRLVIFDEIAGPKLIAPVDIYIDGSPFITSTNEYRHAFRLLYGEHNITIAPSKGSEAIYQPSTITMFIDSDINVDLTMKRVRYSVLIEVVDELTRGKPIAPVVVTVAGTAYTVSPEVRAVNLSLPYGSYTVSFKPVRGFESVYLPKDVSLDVPKVSSLTVPMTRVTYMVRLAVKDLYAYRLIAPVNIALNNTLIKANTTENEHLLRIPYGVWMLSIVPAEGYSVIYDRIESEILVNGSLNIELVIDRVHYPITVNLIDIYRVIVSPIDVVLEGPVITVRNVQPPGAPISLYLPYGEYRLNVRPLNTSIYVPYQTKILIDSPKSIAVPIQRVSYKVEVRVVDTLIGVVRGLFALYANETKVLENIGASYTINMPYGVYVLKLVPMSGFERTYEPSPPVTVTVAGNTTVTIPVVRKTYRLRLSVMEGANPVANAIAYIYSLESYELVAQAISDPSGIMEVSIPYGEYRILVKHGMYVEQEIPFCTIDRDMLYTFDLRPTITTLIWRYAPIAGVLIGVGIAIYVIMRIRAAIAKRLVAEELF